MMRRRVLQFLMALPIVASRRATAVPAEVGHVYDGELIPSVWSSSGRIDGQAPKGQTLVRDNSGDRVALRRALRTRTRQIDSISNGNERYRLEIELLNRPTGESWIIDTTGRAVRYLGRNERVAYFDIDRALADVLAKQGGVERRDRAQPGSIISGSWRAKRPTVKLGDPIEIEVAIKNTGNCPATMVFGPLGSPFALSVSGVASQSTVFTGPLGLRTLLPGASFTLDADLRWFAKLDRIGEYDVACTLNLEEVTGTTYPVRPSERWDRALQGTVKIRMA